MSEDSTKFREGAAEERSSSPEHTSIPQPGDVLAGKYRIVRTLGEGGMGIVVEAMHLQLRQTVALKFMLPRALVNKDAIARFEREARAAVRLKSSHVAKVLDTGTLENGAPYMVMEHLDGRTLSSVVRASESGLPIDEAVDYLLQACEGVAEAHALGIVHRDLKPANLFLSMAADGTPTVKVLDFGVSKVGALAGSAGDAEDEERVTKTQGVVGSPLYMSPEQMRSSRDVDHRSDIWSLGVCLFQMLTAKVPFEAETVHQQYVMLMLEEAPKPSSVRADIPPELDAVVVRCLQRDRDTRFATVGELARALAPFAPAHALASVDRVARTLAADRSGKYPSVPRSGSIPPRSASSASAASSVSAASSPTSPSSSGSGTSLPFDCTQLETTSAVPPAAASLPPAANVPAAMSSPQPSAPRTDVTWGETTANAATPKDRRVWLVAGVVGALGLAVGFGLAFSRRTDVPAVPAPTLSSGLSTTAAQPSATPSASTASTVVGLPFPSTQPSASTAPSASVTHAATHATHAASSKASGDTVDLSHRK
ncbi:MAG TPA: serine/threonine-protein kinase [Polyangiaceae bacterium]